jgi:hypothetical protein
VLRRVHLTPCPEISKAIAERLSPGARLAVMPQGPLTIPYLRSPRIPVARVAVCARRWIRKKFVLVLWCQAPDERNHRFRTSTQMAIGSPCFLRFAIRDYFRTSSGSAARRRPKPTPC